eukprot:TRINITY_DN9919_c0_g1_i3.p1 TRINITY_DN9919_c0_g1~~TRINITY_DN9919_c0_g1_i3.p1  ORF type:complete len:228 (+),score=38.66 TRINITY_DN9919_c0_g1_i3:83-766(+)
MDVSDKSFSCWWCQVGSLSCDGNRPCSSCIDSNKQHQCYGMEVGTTDNKNRKRPRNAMKDSKYGPLPMAPVHNVSTVNPALFYNNPVQSLLSTSDWQKEQNRFNFNQIQALSNQSLAPTGQPPLSPSTLQTQMLQIQQIQQMQQMQQLQLQQQMQSQQNQSQTLSSNSFQSSVQNLSGQSIAPQQQQVMIYPRSFGLNQVLYLSVAVFVQGRHISTKYRASRSIQNQ